MSYEVWGDGDDGPDWRDRALEEGWIDPVDVSKALLDVMNERDRQHNEEGWTPEHDDQHTERELAWAASCYARSAATRHPYTIVPLDWPWASESWKPADRRRNLVKAGALILAEIERLDRAAPPATEASNDL